MPPLFLVLGFLGTARPARFARMCDVGARGFRLLGLVLSLALGLAWGLAWGLMGWGSGRFIRDVPSSNPIAPPQPPHTHKHTHKLKPSSGVGDQGMVRQRGQEALERGLPGVHGPLEAVAPDPARRHRKTHDRDQTRGCGTSPPTSVFLYCYFNFCTSWYVSCGSRRTGVSCGCGGRQPHSAPMVKTRTDEPTDASRPRSFYGRPVGTSCSHPLDWSAHTRLRLSVRERG